MGAGSQATCTSAAEVPGQCIVRAESNIPGRACRCSSLPPFCRQFPHDALYSGRMDLTKKDVVLTCRVLRPGQAPSGAIHLEVLTRVVSTAQTRRPWVLLIFALVSNCRGWRPHVSRCTNRVFRHLRCATLRGLHRQRSPRPQKSRSRSGVPSTLVSSGASNPAPRIQQHLG